MNRYVLFFTLAALLVGTTGCGPVCAAGTANVAGECVPNCGSGTHSDPSTHACVPDVACGIGTAPVSGQCVPAIATCAPGTHQSGASCVSEAQCGAGTHLVDGKCTPDADACHAGTHLDAASAACIADVVCGPDTQAINGSCVPRCAAGYNATQSGCIANCGPGTFLDTKNNTCSPDVICGAGTQVADGHCIPLTVVTCAAGTHLGGTSCLPDETCGAGTHEVGGHCVPDTGACGAGTHLDALAGRCAPDVTCGSGTVVQNGQCIPKCSAGFTLSGTECVPNCGPGTHANTQTLRCEPDVTCGTGTQASGATCVPSTTITCAAGTHLSGSSCVADTSCGTGTHAVGATCVPDAGACGAGTHLQATTNSCAPDVTCGPNTIAVGDACVLALNGGGPTVWGPNTQLSPTGAVDATPLVAYEPQIAAAVPSAGVTDVYVAYPAFYGSGSEIRIDVSHDGGATFQQHKDIRSNDPAFTNVEHLGDPTIVAKGSIAYVAFIKYENAGGGLYYVSTADRGVTWSAPRLLTTSTVFVDRPFWSNGRDGNLYLSFTWSDTSNTDTWVYQFTPTTNRIFSHALSASLSERYLSQAPVVATSAGRLFGTLDLNGGDVHQVGIVNAPNDDSAPFRLVTAREMRQARDNNFRNADQWLSINRFDQMLLTWRYNQSGSTHVAATVTNGGAWSTGLGDFAQIDDAPDAVAVNCAYPTNTADENGHWHALWVDNRYGSWGTYSSSSADGVTWTPSSLVSDSLYDETGPYDPNTGRVRAFLGDYISIAASGGKLFAAWVDTRSGTSQVFFATAPNPL